jgi:hypothetical protein
MNCDMSNEGILAIDFMVDFSFGSSVSEVDMRQIRI